jgi:HEAT repeat protein
MPLFGGPNVNKLKSKRDIPELAKVMRYTSDWKVRQSAAEALGELADASAVGPLIYSLGYDDKEHVRWSAAQALGRIRDVKALDPLLEAATRDSTISVRSAAAEAIVQIGEPAVKPLIAVLPHSWQAAQILGRLGDKRAVMPLIKVLPMNAAIVALGELGDKRAVRPLIDILGGDDMADMAAAAKSLAQIGDRSAVEPLMAVLGDQTHEDLDRWRWAVIGALGQLGDPRAVEPLIALLNDPNQNESEHQITARALESLGIPPDQWHATTAPRPATPPPGLN